MRRSVRLALFSSLFCSCGGGASGTVGHAYLAGDLPVRLPVASIQARRFLTVKKQQLDFSCGSAALATLLTYHHGDPQDERSVFLGMWNDGDQSQIRRLGFSLLDMKRYLERRGISADGYSVSLPEIERAGVPGIALVNVSGYRHFVVLKGIDAQTVLIGDPALGLRRLPRAEFQKMWNGVLFVVMLPGEQPPVFNGSRDRSLAPAALDSPVASRPVSIQALALTRPLPGEF